MHPDMDVRCAIIKLADALCQWERATGMNSVLILREERGFYFRAQSGKPGIPDDITDDQLLASINPSHASRIAELERENGRLIAENEDLKAEAIARKELD